MISKSVLDQLPPRLAHANRRAQQDLESESVILSYPAALRYGFSADYRGYWESIEALVKREAELYSLPPWLTADLELEFAAVANDVCTLEFSSECDVLSFASAHAMAGWLAVETRKAISDCFAANADIQNLWPAAIEKLIDFPKKLFQNLFSSSP